MDKVLIMYDLTGHVWNVVYDADEAPQGIPCVWTDMPSNAVIDHVDPVTKEVIFTYLPETDLGQLQQEMRNLTSHVSETEEQTTRDIGDLQSDSVARQEDITNIQIALAEVYEAMLGEEAK